MVTTGTFQITTSGSAVSSSSSFNISSTAIANLNGIKSYDTTMYSAIASSGDYTMIDGITLYCTINRTASYSAEVPDYSVEKIERDTDGNITSKAHSYVADTIQRKPLTIDITIFESNMAMTESQAANGTMASRVATIKNALLEIADSGKVFEFVTPKEIYENMVISSLSFPEDDYLNAMEIKVSMQQVSFTSSYEVTDSIYEYGGASDSDSGTTDTTEVVETETGDSSSSTGEQSESSSNIWSDFCNWFSNLFSGNGFKIGISLS